MIDLKRRAGLPVFLRKDNKLGSKTVKLPKVDVRTFREIKPVLLNKKTKVKKFYFMYRNLAPQKCFSKYEIRYDITIIPGHKIGKEEVKTTGHYHAHVRKTKLTYPEVYQVIKGKAICLLQKKTGNKISDVIIAKVKAGDVVLVPPNYGHITINPSKETLVMANLVYGGFKSQYRKIIEKHGGAYYAVEDGSKIKFIKNPNYRDLPKARFRKPMFEGLKSPIYTDCVHNPEKYLFLVKPQKYKSKMKV